MKCGLQAMAGGRSPRKALEKHLREGRALARGSHLGSGTFHAPGTLISVGLNSTRCASLYFCL
jgi:hypothetical protein